MPTAACSCTNAPGAAASPVRSTATAGSADTRWCRGRGGRCGGACGSSRRCCRLRWASRTASHKPRCIASDSSQAHRYWLVRTVRESVIAHNRIVRTIRGVGRLGLQALPIQPLAALHAKAVAPQVVMPARWADQPARRISLQPALVLTPVPDPVLRSEHPAPALAVQHCEIANGDSEGARLKVPRAPLLDEKLVSDLCVREGIHSHAGEYGPATDR